jgi:hypothetical protein
VVSPIHDARFIDLILADHRGSSRATLASAPGTGLESPETGRQNRRYRDLDRRKRPHVSHLNPRKCPQSAGYSSETEKRRFASDCVVVDAVRIEPVSTAKFPANRENNREFLRILVFGCDFDTQSARQFNGFQLNSLCNRTGNFQTRIREIFSRNREFGNFHAKILRFCILSGTTGASTSTAAMPSDVLRVAQSSISRRRWPPWRPASVPRRENKPQ